MTSGKRRLIVILGDQLTRDIASIRGGLKRTDVVFMAEVEAEAGYVGHHRKKLAFVFSAMRHFARELEGAGWEVDYVKLDDPDNTGTLPEEVARAARRHGVSEVRVTAPGEWRLRDSFDALRDRLKVPLDIREDDRFVCSVEAFADWASERDTLRLEHFYRSMRRRTGLLMDGGKPAGGRWNYDSENRKPPERNMTFPEPYRVAPDELTRDVLKLVDDRFADNFGTLDPFWFAVRREDAEAAFDHFVETALPNFGDHQDAMVAGEGFLFHAVTSLYLNIGLLDPLAMCRRVEAAWRDGTVPLNAAEGFIRQIIGWREYVRGIYWLEGADYVHRNFLEHDRSLPRFYWTGDTDLGCLAAAIGQTRDEAYAHHIQRLMLTGNFALLTGVDPKQVHEWYLAVYADAYEWVELPNTLGMSQFADGGLLASKPYVASGNYINRMSDYCADCRYDVKQKNGEGACPFNYLYWHFLDRHRDRLGDNVRLAQTYSTWDRMDEARRQTVRDDAATFLNRLDTSG